MDVTQFIENNEMQFWSTIDREETQFSVDMGQVPVTGKMECIVMTGVHKGDVRWFPWLSLNTLWEQQNEIEPNQEDY